MNWTLLTAFVFVSVFSYQFGIRRGRRQAQNEIAILTGRLKRSSDALAAATKANQK